MTSGNESLTVTGGVTCDSSRTGCYTHVTVMYDWLLYVIDWLCYM